MTPRLQAVPPKRNRAPLILLLAALALTGLGFAARYGEDNHVGSSGLVSWWLFVFAGLCAYWALLGLIRRLLNWLRRR